MQVVCGTGIRQRIGRFRHRLRRQIDFWLIGLLSRLLRRNNDARGRLGINDRRAVTRRVSIVAVIPWIVVVPVVMAAVAVGKMSQAKVQSVMSVVIAMMSEVVAAMMSEVVAAVMTVTSARQGGAVRTEYR